MKKLLLFLPIVMLTSACAATLTPSGELYTELLVPTSTVVVQKRPVHVRAGHRPHHHSPNLLAARPHHSAQHKPALPKPSSYQPVPHGRGPR